MYSRSNKIISSEVDLSNYVEGYDLFNSVLIDQLSDTSLEKETYVVTTKEYRPDLIAEEIYGSSSYTGLLMLVAGLPLEGYRRGNSFQYIPKTTLDLIIRKL